MALLFSAEESLVNCLLIWRHCKISPTHNAVKWVRQVCYTALARMAATEGKPDQALEAAREALAAGLHLKLRSFVPALKAYCAAGNVDAAFKVSAEMLATCLKTFY